MLSNLSVSCLILLCACSSGLDMIIAILDQGNCDVCLLMYLHGGRGEPGDLSDS